MVGNKQKKRLSGILSLILVIQLCFGSTGIFEGGVYADKKNGNEPDIPENVIASATTDTIFVEWDQAHKADSYEILIGSELVEGIRDCSYIFEDLTPDTEYSLRVRAVGKKSKSDWSEEVIIRTDIEQDMQGTIPEGEEVPEEGTPDEGTPEEEVPDEGTPDEGTPEEEVSDEGAPEEGAPEEEVSDEGLSDMEMPIEDEGPADNFGSPDEYETELNIDNSHDNRHLDPPENIEAECTDTTISLSWDAVEGAKHYEININGNAKAETNETEYTFKGLKPDKEYKIKIRAIGLKSKSEWSESIVVNTLEEQKIPSIPDDLSAEVTESDITLSWDAAENAESYDIEVNSSIVDNVTVPEYVYGGIEPESEYIFRVRSVNSNAKSAWSEKLRVQTPKIQPIGTGNGLLGEYFDGINFDDPVLTRIDPEIDFDWGFKAPHPDMDGIAFSVKWTGQVQPRYSGKYTFYVYAGNGVRLWVNGKLIIDEWSLLFPKESKGTIELTAGEKYDIRMEYQDLIGKAEVKLSWASKDQKKQVIPQSQLYCMPQAPGDITAIPGITSVALKWNEVPAAESYDIDINGEIISEVIGSEYLIENLTPDTEYSIKLRSVSSFGTSEWSKAVEVSTLEEQYSVTGNGNGLTGKYYDNIIFKKLRFERVDKTIDFDWGRGTPDPMIKGNTFSVRWEGKLLPEYTSKHTIYLYSDDGARLWINGKELIDFWEPHSSKEGSAEIDLIAGEKYDIRIEYFNINKDAKVVLYWSNPYEEKQIIPMEQLYTIPGITGGLKAYAEGSKIVVAWDNTPGAEGYELEVDGVIADVGLEAKYEHTGLAPNTQHTYKVRAVNELGKGEWSAELTKTSAPGIPSNVALEATDTAITVTWDAVEAAESYEIEADGAIIENVSNTGYTHSGLTPNSEHEYRIRSVNAEGKGEWSQAYSRYTLPDTPKNFETAVTSNTITISWDEVPGALGYEIETDGEIQSAGLETSYTHRSLKPNTEHIYRVRAIGLGGTGYWSKEVLASTMLAIPQNFAAKATSSSITLTWDAVVDAQYYDVEINGDITDNGGSTIFTHNGLAPNVEYTYRVRAREDLGAGDWSEPLKVKTLLDTPVNLRAEATDTSVTIAWDAVSDAAGYDVELIGVRTVKVLEPVCVIDGLNPNTMYSYRVIARCEGNESEWSSEHTIITLLGAPSNITFESSSTITAVKWDIVDEADRYEIEVDGIVWDNGTDTSYIHEGLEPDSPHEYRVRAVNENGAGVWSDLLIKTTAPHIPENLSAVSASRANTLSWEPVEEADSYEVEADGEIFEIAGTTFVHMDIEPDSEHLYRVRAVNINGKGDWSGLFKKTTAPHVPSGLNGVSSSTDIQFTWEAVYEAQHYDIEIDSVLLTDMTETAYLHTGLLPNTEHSLRVRAVNSNGTGDWSELFHKYTAPDVPVNIKASSASTTVTLTWDEVEAATGYDVEVLGSPVDNGNSTTFIHSDLPPNIQRAYRVRAKNGNGIGDWSELVAVTTLAGAPVNLKAISAETAIRFIWDPAAGASAYDIEADGAILEEITTAEYELSGLMPNSVHTFRARSRNGEGVSEWSEVITASTLPAVPKFTLAESSCDSVRTVWESVYGPESYEIEVDGTVIDCGANSEYIHQGLQPNTSHTYRVRAKNEYVTGNWSSLIVKWTLTDAPQNLSASATGNSIKLTWDKVNEAAGYDIEADGIIVSLGIDTSYLHENLMPNTEHVYRVRARNEAGAGKWSAEAKAFTLFGVPQNITTFSDCGSIRMVWDEVYGVTGYEIEADGSLIEIGAEKEYIHSGLMPNTTHIYRIRAKAGEALGDWSERVAATTLLATIAGIKAVSANTSISLSWTPIGDAESYDLEADGIVIAGIPEPAYVIEGLTPNTSHTFRVMAKSDSNMSDWSEPVTKYTTPDIPENITLFSTTSSITMTWEAVYGAAGYDVEIDGAIIDNGINTSHVHEGLSPNTQHIYRLRARNEYEASQWSTEIIGTTEPELIFSIAEGSLFNFVIAAPKTEGAAGRTITVTYDPEEVEAVDLCAATSKADVEVGDIPGSNLEVMEFTPGKIVFRLKDPDRTIMNAVIFKAKINGQSKILYVIE